MLPLAEVLPCEFCFRRVDGRHELEFQSLAFLGSDRLN